MRLPATSGIQFKLPRRKVDNPYMSHCEISYSFDMPTLATPVARPAPAKIVYLMRGLPSCGKSTTAKKIVGNTGIICETDEYFYKHVGDDPNVYTYDDNLMDAARAWNLARFKQAVDEGISPIVVDRGNSLSIESKDYAVYAIERGYRVELKEPESEWWQEIRVLLKYKNLTRPALYEWAERLAQMNQSTHRTSVRTIKRWMDNWRWDVTIQDILNYEE